MTFLSKIIAAVTLGLMFAVVSNVSLQVGLGITAAGSLPALILGVCLIFYICFAPGGKLAWSRGLFVNGLGVLLAPVGVMFYSAREVSGTEGAVNQLASAVGGGAVVLVVLITCAILSTVFVAVAFALSRKA